MRGDICATNMYDFFNKDVHFSLETHFMFSWSKAPFSVEKVEELTQERHKIFMVKYSSAITTRRVHD